MLMDINFMNAGLFCLAAIALLGSPGPGIAALVATGREQGFLKGLHFYGGLQLGLALAAGISAAGLFSIVQQVPVVMTAMTILATVYLLYLAYAIASAPVDKQSGTTTSRFSSTATGGFLLGITNPKAYIAFMSLMASYPIFRLNNSVDVTAKWLVCVIVMIVVDILWLWLGVIIQSASLSPKAERILNLAMGGTILLTALLAFV